MGSFTATLLSALLSAGVSPDRAREVVEQFDRAIDERFGLHAQVIATKRDVAEIQATLPERIAASSERIARTNERIAELDRSLSGRIAELDRSLSGRIAELDRSLSGRVTELDRTLSARIAATNARIAESKADLAKWMLGALTAQTALILGAFKLL